MCTIRERTDSFAALCNWIRDLSNSVEELSYTTNTPAMWKNVRIRELSYFITESPLIQLESSLIQLQISLIQLKSSFITSESSLIQ